MIHTSWLAIFVIVLYSCTHTPISQDFSPPAEDSAQMIACKDWPLQTKDLSIDEIFLSSQHNAEFAISQNRSRKNTRNYYLTKLDSKFDARKDQMKLFKLADEESINSLAQFGKLGALVSERNEGEAIIRSLPKNNLIANIKVPSDAYNLTLIGNKFGFWLQHQKPEDDSFYLQSFDLKNPKKTGSTIKALSRPKIIELGAAAFAVWPSQGNFVLQSLSTGKMIPFLKISENVESWDLMNDGNTLLLAMVDGDSLVEGVSKLNIYSFLFSPKKVQLIWKKSIAMNDRHISTPVWLPGNSPTLNITHWIQKDALLTRYVINPSKGVTKVFDAGKLPNDQNILGFIAAKTPEKLRFLTRTKTKTFWKFRLCEL